MGFSIITNFGCTKKCSYCVWRNKPHPLKDLRTTNENTDWDRLLWYASDYDKISVSGGGDPLNEFDENKEWWNHLIENYRGKIDVHTALVLPVIAFMDKVVIHLDYNDFCDEEIRE